jgi:hypothetical protein
LLVVVFCFVVCLLVFKHLAIDISLFVVFLLFVVCVVVVVDFYLLWKFIYFGNLFFSHKTENQGGWNFGGGGAGATGGDWGFGGGATGLFCFDLSCLIYIHVVEMCLLMWLL